VQKLQELEMKDQFEGLFEHRNDKSAIEEARD